mgnify:CR=1 FL=1
MVFSSLFFLYLFLPLSLIAYYVAKPRYRNAVLIVCSLVFYAWGEPIFIWLLLMSTLLNYLFGRLISADPESRTAKVSLVLSLVFHLGMLILFKYTGFFIENLNNWFSLSIPVPNFPLPIGISFYTFRAVSYIVDCYWGKVEAEQKFSRFLLYMTFFPVIMQGPIARYETMQNQLAVRRCNPSDLYEGMMRVIIGLGKKVIIADNLGNIVDQFLANGNIEQQTTLGAWYGVIVYAMQIYFDFSGYSDMAIGIARMMGFQLEENFRHPFLCKDITEFWQRWHISLGTFFRDYVLYIPIFGKRRKYGGLFLVWFCTGLWHGASWTFVIWGLYHGVFLLLEEFIPILGRLPKVINHIYALLAVTVGFVIFRADTIGQGFDFIGNMFAGFNITDKSLSLALTQLTPWFIVMFNAAIIGCTPIKPIADKFRISGSATALVGKKQNVAQTVLYVLAFALLIWCIIRLSGTSYNPFIYFRF